MNLKEALAKLATELPEVAELINTHISSLNAESADRRVKLTNLNQTIADNQKVIEALKAIAGDDTDLVKFATEVKTKTESSDKVIAELQSKLDAAVLAAATSHRQLLMVEAAQKSGADQNALNELLKDVAADKIAVGESVTVEGKPLKDYAIEKGKFWERALFLQGTVPDQVPTGGASPEAPKNPTTVYLESKTAALAKDLGLV